MTEPQLSYLDLINLCDNFHPPLDGTPPVGAKGFEAEPLIPFYLSLNKSQKSDRAIIGLLRPIIISTLKHENKRSRDLGQHEIWELRYLEEWQVLNSGRKGPSVGFSDWVNEGGWMRRNEVMKEVCERWRDEVKDFEGVCGRKKWREEMYPVYREPFGRHDHPMMEDKGEEGMNYAFEMERSACALFGIITHGVHMSVYKERVDEEGKRSLSVWVPTRAKTKQTFPGMLDNTVAGGIPSGMGMFEAMIKECMEEASFEAWVVERYARATGVISYFYRTSAGWLQPEIEYVYDIAIPTDTDEKLFEPKPMDGEVECFELMDQRMVTEKLLAGQFKPNCGLVLIDLLMRLGYITADNEGEYMEIATRLRGRFRYSAW